jgi:hypothetical protein
MTFRGPRGARGPGLGFDEPPRERPWDAEAVIPDPDGNKLVLHQA